MRVAARVAVAKQYQEDRAVRLGNKLEAWQRRPLAEVDPDLEAEAAPKKVAVEHPQALRKKDRA